MPTITLFPNQDDIKQYVPAIHRNMAGNTLMPFVQDAEQHELIPYLGQDLYDDLIATTSPENNALLPYVKSVVAWFAYYRALPTLRTVMADMGLQQQTDREGTSTPANEEQYNTALWNAYRTGWDKLEVLLWNFLVPNAADYPLWTAWDGSSLTSDLFLYSPKIFQQYHPLQTPGALETWLKLRPLMRRIELYYIKPVLCDDLFAELKTQIAADNVTPENAIILEFVRDAVAAYTVVDAAAKLNLQLTARGAKNRTSTDSRYSRNTPTDRDYEHLYTNENGDIARAMETLKQYLYVHRADYPLWEASDCNPENSLCLDPCNPTTTYSARTCNACHNFPCSCRVITVSKKGIIGI